MPCRDYDEVWTSPGAPNPITSDERVRWGLKEAEYKSRLNKLSKMLCAVCEMTEVEGMPLTLPEDVKQWWNKHQEADRRNK